jgi:hypothetical protein
MLTGDDGTAYLSGGGSVVAMDVVTWSPRWTATIISEPVAALAGGGVLVSDGTTLMVLDAQGSPTDSLSVSLTELSIPLARGLIYGVDETEGQLTVLAGPELDQALFAFQSSGGIPTNQRAPREPACPGDAARSRLILSYEQLGVTFYRPVCADIRTSLSSSYLHVTWNSLIWHDWNTEKPLGIIFETMAAKVSDTIGAYQALTMRTVTISSGYRTPTGNGSKPEFAGKSKNTSRHLSGESVDLQVLGFLDSAHHGGGPEDDSSEPFVNWRLLKDAAVENQCSRWESWQFLYNALFLATGATTGQNHMHASWYRTPPTGGCVAASGPFLESGHKK